MVECATGLAWAEFSAILREGSVGLGASERVIVGIVRVGEVEVVGRAREHLILRYVGSGRSANGYRLTG